MIIDNSKVRRQDRLMQQSDAERLLCEGEYGVLSMATVCGREAVPYAVPISYVWDGSDAIYMHCATEGRKLQTIDANPSACFTVVGNTEVNAQQFTTAYSSLILQGQIERLSDPDAKQKAIELFIRKYCPGNVEAALKAASRSMYRTEILRFCTHSASAKQKTASQKSKTRLSDGV